MRGTQSAYDVLGLPYDAPPSQVRTRYRQLVRRYQPDLEPQALLEDDAFLRLVRAYLVLDSPRRAEYTRVVRASRGAPLEMPDLYSRLSRADQILLAAEAGVARRQFKAAARLAKEALEENPHSARGYGLLGDILRLQGKYGESISMYNYAIQFDPDNRRYWQLLEEATALREGRRVARATDDVPGHWHRSLQVWIMLGAVAVFIELSVLVLRAGRGPALFFGIPGQMLAIAALDGVLAGLALAATDLLAPYDDEMISYSVAAYGVQTAPVAVFVLLPGLVCFWVALPFYAITASLDEHASASIVLALGVTAVLTAAFSFIYPEVRLAFLIFGGNFVWAGLNIGWMIGSLRRTVAETDEY
ncbi:MAG TPA: DnaJ domain-containing protein [Armatimonadota bacterium]|nr:DnaJ domain-containing protein [Armatimonadota bacterium]